MERYLLKINGELSLSELDLESKIYLQKNGLAALISASLNRYILWRTL